MNKSPDLSGIQIDFASASNNHRRLYGGGRGQPIARAIGLKTYGLPLTVLDCTAGLGQDSFVLASLGCDVTLLERSPSIAAMLRTALEQAATVTDLHDIIQRIKLHEINSLVYLNELIKTPEFYPDVVYLDPMFPERTKTALVKKELRYLKEVVGDDPDADLLLPAALKVARRRIVVKRPRIAPYLNSMSPHSSQIGKANRFDIYMPNTKV